MDRNTARKQTAAHRSSGQGAAHNKKKGHSKKRKNSGNTLPLILLLFTVALVAVTLLIVFSDDGQDAAGSGMSSGSTLLADAGADPAQSAAAETVNAGATIEAVQTAAPGGPVAEVRTGTLTETGEIAQSYAVQTQPTAAPAATQAPTATPTAAPTAEPFQYLPVYSKGRQLRQAHRHHHRRLLPDGEPARADQADLRAGRQADDIPHRREHQQPQHARDAARRREAGL